MDIAFAAYENASNEDTPSHKEGMLFENWMNSDEYGGQLAEFAEKIREFAAFRGELLRSMQQGEVREDACARLTKQYRIDETWMPYLNAPAGYANPKWDIRNLCLPITELE